MLKPLVRRGVVLYVCYRYKLFQFVVKSVVRLSGLLKQAVNHTIIAVVTVNVLKALPPLDGYLSLFS